MAIKITNYPLCTSPGTYVSEVAGSGLIKLEEYSKMLLANSVYDSVNSGVSLENTIPTGNPFFYNVEQFNDETGNARAVVESEKGIGEIIVSGSDLYLVRHITLENKLPQDTYSSPSFSLTSFSDFENERVLTVSSYTPSDYRQLCAPPDCVICSTNPFQPEPVELDPSGILGRKSGEITSLTGQDVGDILLESSFLTDAAKTITKFDLTHTDSLITANELRCKGTRVRPTSPAAGSITRLRYKIEAQDLQPLAKGTSSAKASSLSFYVKTNKTGVYTVFVYDDDNNRMFSASYTVSDTNWNR